MFATRRTAASSNSRSRLLTISRTLWLIRPRLRSSTRFDRMQRAARRAAIPRRAIRTLVPQFPHFRPALSAVRDTRRAPPIRSSKSNNSATQMRARWRTRTPRCVSGRTKGSRCKRWGRTSTQSATSHTPKTSSINSARRPPGNRVLGSVSSRISPGTSRITVARIGAPRLPPQLGCFTNRLAFWHNAYYYSYIQPDANSTE